MDTIRDSENVPDVDRLVKKETVAERLSVSKRTLENWMARGIVPYVRIGSVTRFVWADVRVALEKFTVKRGGGR